MIVSTIIMALILYTLTLDKIHDIAMLKLMGARNRVIVGLDPATGLAAWRTRATAWPIGWATGFSHCSRGRWSSRPRICGCWPALSLGISVLASLFGIWKALRVEPNKVLS